RGRRGRQQKAAGELSRHYSALAMGTKTMRASEIPGSRTQRGSDPSSLRRNTLPIRTNPAGVHSQAIAPRSPEVRSNENIERRAELATNNLRPSAEKDRPTGEVRPSSGAARTLGSPPCAAFRNNISPASVSATAASYPPGANAAMAPSAVSINLKF